MFLSMILVFTALLYLKGWLSLRSGFIKRPSAWRAFSFQIGLFLIWVAVASPIAALDHELLTVHMLQHLLLMTLTPPLIWLGAPGGPLSHALSRRLTEALLPLWQSRAGETIGKLLGRARFTWLAACAALIGWHIPTLFALGMRSPAWHLFEQLSFLVTGLLFWWPVVQPSASSSRQDLSLILYLFFATLPCDILSGFLVFSDRVVYPMYFSSSHLLVLSPLEDQQCAAALMWTCVTIVYFIAGAILTMRLLSPRAFPEVGLAQGKLSGTVIGHRVSQSAEAV
jgi:cytochrome c oxidase assembly factor CtaG